MRPFNRRFSMFFPFILLLTSLSLVSALDALGSKCRSLGPGTAGPNDPYWLERIAHKGISAFNPNPSEYKVFRNVKDYGARGDGVTDDTDAINRAISEGGRCGEGNCKSSTVTPALVYFPQGTYLVSKPVIAYYYTQLIGDARKPPTLLAAPNFEGLAIIDADPYIPGGNGAQWYINQVNFFRVVRNFVIDSRRMPAAAPAYGIHWQVSQATSLQNLVFHMSTDNGTNHQGIWMENGSGGYMGDLTFNGGKYGMWVGNQQFTVRNVVFKNAGVAVFAHWNWGWTFQGITIKNCSVGFDLATGSVEAEAIIDADVIDTPVFIRNSKPSNGTLAGSLVLNNIKLTNVPVAVGVLNGTVVLEGGTKTIESWAQGNIYHGTNPNGQFVQADIPAPHKSRALLDNRGWIYGRGRPQYEDYAVSQIINVKDYGAKGDGHTDDTKAIKEILDKYAACKIIFFDAGTYIVTSTITIPEGAHIVGEAWSVIAGTGDAFKNPKRPEVVVKVGKKGSEGVVEISDMIFSTIGPAAGAIVVEWNIRQSSQGSAGMWDTHIRLGGSSGTNLEFAQCPKFSANYEQCAAAFLALHLTPRSTAYLSATWVWLADHDLDGDGSSQISIYSGRGILSESAGPVWMVGTGSEHHVLYQYSLVNAKQHYMGLIQTESPYYQPVPAPPTPFSIERSWHDPTFEGLTSSWGLWARSSSDILVFGAGLYSFFSNYGQECLKTTSCQSQIVNIEDCSSVSIYSLNTVGTTYQISVDQQGIVNQNSNLNGFASTLTAWTPSKFGARAHKSHAIRRFTPNRNTF